MEKFLKTSEDYYTKFIFKQPLRLIRNSQGVISIIMISEMKNNTILSPNI